MTLAPTPAPLTGQLIDGRYRVGEVIGRGAMSEVYRAVDIRLDRTLALKALRPGVTDRDRFDEESSLLCSLDHPNLVKLHDAGEHDGVPYLVLNLLDRSLAEVLRSGPVGPQDAARAGAEVASALAYLHERGIVHRDVKPSNVLLRSDGSACLADLGAALSSDAVRRTATGMTIGTPMYLAPEQATGEEVTSAADVYSLGLVVLESATGRAPFEGRPQEALAARLTGPPPIPSTLPSDLAAAITSMVAVDPALRPDARAIGSDLLRASIASGPAVDGDLATTAVLPATTQVVPHVPAPVPDPDAVDRGVEAAVAASAVAYERARHWFGDRRHQRAVLWGVVAVLVVGMLIVLAAADRGLSVPETSSEPSTTVATTVPPTTVPATVVPAEQQPQNSCEEGCGNGREGDEEKDGHEKDEGKD